MSVNEIVMWCVFNKGQSKAFSNMTYEQIYAEIEEAIKNDCCLVDIDDTGYITGVLVVEPRLHIKDLITTNTKSFGVLTDIARKMFPYIKIFQAWRRNRLTVYRNPNRMIDKALKLTEVSHG